jgi:alpha-D-xyloside xylohydrolase
MKKSIDWNSIAAPLDVRDIYAPKEIISRWVSYERTKTGVLFHCELADGSPLAYAVDVVYPDVIRLRWNPDNIYDCESDMLAEKVCAWSAFTTSEDETKLTVMTDLIRVEFPREWQISAYSDPRPGEGRLFFQERTDDRSYGPGYEVAPSGCNRSSDGSVSSHITVAARPGESFYGLGERFTSLDKWGQEHALWATDSGNVSSYRAYKNIPLLLSSAGYGLFVHSSYPMVFKLGSESNITYSVHLCDAQFDAFLMYGPSFKDILRRYTDLTGRAPVPPKWSFGFWISRAGYRNRDEVEDVVKEMRTRGFPCDVLSLDPWWMGDGPWCSYEWDTQAFQQPEEMMAWMREQGVRTCLWIHPYVPIGTPLYEECATLGFFVKCADGSCPAAVIEAFSGEQLGAVDFTNPDACEWWQDKLEKLMDMGVAVFKTDFGEQAPLEAVYADGRCGLEMHNLYPLLYNRTAFELTQRKNGRGLVWGRSAYAGSQRYPVQWGGDSYATLDQLASQVRGLLSYGLSGVPFCSHDVGGFDYSPHFFDHTDHVDFSESYDPKLKNDYPKDPVVYARWLQVGVFSSHIRAHGKQAREPWTYGPEVEQISHRYLDLRYRLLPYLYTQAVVSSQTGLPMVRPLVLEFQEDPTTRHIDWEYMFGDSFLVAPALTADHTATIYLPAGNWVDYWSKEVIAGGRWMDVTAPLDVLPLWVKGGEVIPYGPVQDYVGQKPLDPLTLEFYLPADSGQMAIHDEDLADIAVRYQRQAGELVVWVGQTTGALDVTVYGETVTGAVNDGQALALEVVPGGFKVSLDGRSGCEIHFQVN